MTLFAQTLVEAPSTTAWARFDKYARRIRSAVLRDNQRPLFHVEKSLLVPAWSVDWDSVLEYYPGHQLLTSLTHLSYDIRPDAQYAHVFLKPPLRNLSVMFSSRSSAVTLLKALSACAQTLCKLRLTKLGDDTLTLDALDHFASLPTLKYLSFEVSVPVALVDQFISTPLHFPALETVCFLTHWVNFESFGHLMHKISAPELQHLTIEFDTPEPFVQSRVPHPSAAHVDYLFAAIAKFPSLTMLEICQCGTERRSMWHDARIDRSILSQLFQLQNLDSIDLSLIPITLSSLDMGAIASAWPNLMFLNLGDCAGRGVPGIHIEDLVPFALQCPKLKTLGLSLKIPSPRKPQCELAVFQSTSALEQLYISDLGLRFSADDAVVLATLFPQARLARHVGYEDEDEDEVDVVDIEQMNSTMRAVSWLMQQRRVLCPCGSLSLTTKDI